MQPASPAPISVDRHIMRRDEVEQKTGFKRSHIYNLMKADNSRCADALARVPSVGIQWRSSSGFRIDCQ